MPLTKSVCVATPRLEHRVRCGPLDVEVGQPSVELSGQVPADDAFFPIEDGRRLADALPNSRLEVIAR